LQLADIEVTLACILGRCSMLGTGARFVAVVFAATMVFPIYGHAEIPGNSPAFNKCINAIKEGPNGSRWGPFGVCQREELARQDRRLNSGYSKLSTEVKTLGPDSSSKLLQGQRQWMAYRDAWCAFEARPDAPPTPEVNGMLCKIELTTQQAELIEEQLDELGGPKR